MNKKSYLFIAFAFLTLGLSKVEAASRFGDVYQVTEVTASSATVFTGAGFVRRIWNSSGTVAGNWAVLIDTGSATPGSPYSAYLSSQKKSEAILFNTTSTIAGSMRLDSMQQFEDPGVFISSAAFVYRTTTSSGEANKTFIEWTR